MPPPLPETVVDELIGLTGYLPLAIWLLARVDAMHPAWTLADLKSETRASMLTLTAEGSSVAAVFDVSYRHLPAGRQNSSAASASTLAPQLTHTLLPL